MLLESIAQKPTDVVVTAAKSGSVIKIEAVNHRAGWKLAFEQGPIPDFALGEEMSSESALLSVCKAISGHIDLNGDGVPDEHFGSDSALEVENGKLKDDLAAARAALATAQAARGTVAAELVAVRAELEAAKSVLPETAPDGARDGEHKE